MSISNLIQFKLNDNSLDGSHVNITYETGNSITFGYPCNISGDNATCTPYVIDVTPGRYRFECWGSRGNGVEPDVQPGKGAYTSGTIVIPSVKRFYVYIGKDGYFNALKSGSFGVIQPRPGGATDVRLVYHEDWWDNSSLISRIMVAAGGGGAEWATSIGGNGGEIEGGPSNTSYYPDQPCPGANQTSGSQCPNYTTYWNVPAIPVAGEFGGSLWANNTDPGGCGGGGYYGGTSYPYAYGGSGGSSFISGHDGCDAVENNSEVIIHTGNSLHYSGIYFTNTQMIDGNETYMPLPYNHEKGRHDGFGSFRITFLSPITIKTTKRIPTKAFIIALVLSHHK